LQILQSELRKTTSNRGTRNIFWALDLPITNHRNIHIDFDILFQFVLILWYFRKQHFKFQFVLINAQWKTTSNRGTKLDICIFITEIIVFNRMVFVNRFSIAKRQQKVIYNFARLWFLSPSIIGLLLIDNIPKTKVKLNVHRQR
jgi:hypothetical protein